MINLVAATKVTLSTFITNPKLGAIGGVLGTTIAYLAGGHGTVLISLCLLIVIDIVTGIIGSLKTGTKIESGIMMKGLVKILLYMLCSLAVIQLDQFLAGYIGTDVITNFVLGYIASVEFISILENLSKAGLKVPDIKKLLPGKFKD